VTNDAGEIAASVRANYIKVSEPTTCVARAGQAPAYPYVTWATAPATFRPAWTPCSNNGVALVSNGLPADRRDPGGPAGHGAQREGPAVTLINGNWSSGGGLGCILVRHTNAVIDGFTITNGYGTTANGATSASGTRAVARRCTKAR